jgi:hypothetical protein
LYPYASSSADEHLPKACRRRTTQISPASESAQFYLAISALTHTRIYHFHNQESLYITKLLSKTSTPSQKSTTKIMPNIKTIRKSIAILPAGPPLVVALTGGTTGIGSYIARALARTYAQHGTKLRVYIVGRNASRAEELIAYGRSTSPGSDWRFIPTPDLTLMSEVGRVSAAIIDLEEKKPFAGGKARLDLLYMSQALSPLQPSPRTYFIPCFQSKTFKPDEISQRSGEF